MERYSRKKTDIKYSSPDGIRPNSDLLRRTRENFNRKNKLNDPLISESSTLSPIDLRRNSRSESPQPRIIEGKNRRWTVKQKKSSKPRTNSESQGRGRSKKNNKKANRNNILKLYNGKKTRNYY